MTQAERNRLYLFLGNKIVHLRSEKSYSQEELGQKVHLSRASIVNIEKGRQHPPLHLLWEIAECLGVGIHDLLPTQSDLKIDVDASGLRKEIRRQLGDGQKTEAKIAEFIKSI